MRIFRLVFASMAIILAQPAFADDMDACGPIATACKTAGFSQGDTVGKRFWIDCMQPLLVNKTVSGVTVDAAAVQTCRAYKIEEMKKELNDLQNASSK